MEEAQQMVSRFSISDSLQSSRKSSLSLKIPIEFVSRWIICFSYSVQVSTNRIPVNLFPHLVQPLCGTFFPFVHGLNFGCWTMNIEIMHLCWHPQIIIDCSSPSVIRRGFTFCI